MIKNKGAYNLSTLPFYLFRPSDIVAALSRQPITIGVVFKFFKPIILLREDSSVFQFPHNIVYAFKLGRGSARDFAHVPYVIYAPFGKVKGYR